MNTILLFYGQDGAAAKVKAAEMTGDDKETRVRPIHAEVCITSYKVQAIEFMPDVPEYERKRLLELFGYEVTPALVPPPPPPLLPPDPLKTLPADWRTNDDVDVRKIAAAVSGRTVENRDQAVAVIEEKLTAQ